jgi:hypothetical protein
MVVLGERIHHAPRLAFVGELGKMLEQHGKAIPRNLVARQFENQTFHRCAPNPNQDDRESLQVVNAKSNLNRVNLTSGPWEVVTKVLQS